MHKIALAFALIISSFSSTMAASPEDVARVVSMMNGKETVFVHKGMRYTFWYPVDRTTQNGWLAVWVRRNGTHGQSTLDTFSDHGYEGKVDFGVDGAKSMYFESGKDGSAVKGTEYAGYWQKRYDAAIGAALEYKRHTKK